MPTGQVVLPILAAVVVAFQSSKKIKPLQCRELVMENVGEDGFKAGAGFYEILKQESVSAKKEVVLQYIRSGGDMFSGADARAMVSLPVTGAKKIGPIGVLPGCRAYIQSTSWSRGLKKGQHFMYQMGQC